MRGILQAVNRAPGWAVVPGRKHVHIRHGSQLVAVVPRGRVKDRDRGMRNLVATLRRAGLEL